MKKPGAPKRPHLGVSLLGHPRVTYEGEPFVLTTRRKALPLLGFLLLHRTEDLSRDFVAFTLWPDEQEEDARSKLRSTMYELQRALPPEGDSPWLIAGNTNLRWNPEATVTFDVDEFEAACARSDGFDRAFKLYAGDLLEGIHEDWVVAERERLQNVLAGALEAGIAAARIAGDGLRAVAYAQRLLAIDPFREDVVRRIMTLRHEAGDRAGALAEFRRFDRLAREELGVEPMSETQALRDAIARDELAFEAAGEAPESGTTAPERLPPFVGRERELATLRERWASARRKHGTLVFVGGEAGIGKSALIARFAREVSDGGGRVMRGATSSPEALPYECAIEALRGALPLVAALRLEPVWMRTLATLIPEIGALANVRDAPPELAREAQGDRVREAFGRAVAALAATRPLLLVLEDLQWGSSATLALVADLARRAIALPVTIVVTYRSDEATRDHPLARLTRELLASPSVAALPVGPLERGDVETLARTVGAPPELAEAAYETSRGNAFYAAQLLSAEPGESALPNGVRDFVAERVARLPEEARHVAEIAALLGAQFSRECVREVAGWNEAEIGDALDVLVARRLLRERIGRSAFDFAFTHQLVCDVIESLAPGTPDRHHRVARVIESCLPALAVDLAAKIGSHYERAGDRAEAIRNYLVAARRALDLGSVADAQRSVERGLALATVPAERIALLKLGFESASRADVAREDAYGDALQTIAHESGDEVLIEYVLLARLQTKSRNNAGPASAQAAKELRERALRTGDRYLLALADFYDVRDAQWPAEHTAALLPPALEIFRARGDARHTAQALATLALALQRMGRIGESAALQAELATYDDPAHPHEVRMAALRAPFTMLMESGDIDQTADVTDRWIARTLAAGDRREELVARESSSWPLLMRSLPGRALAQLDAALDIGHAIGARHLTTTTIINRAVVLNRIGGFAETIATLEGSGFEDYAERRQGTARSVLTAAYAGAGDIAAARAQARIGIAAMSEDPLPSKRGAMLESIADMELSASAFDAATARSLECAAVRTEANIAGAERSFVTAAFAQALAGDLARAKTYLDASGGGSGPFARNQTPERTAFRLATVSHALGDDSAAERWLATAETTVAAVIADLDPARAATYADAPWVRDIRAARAGTWPAGEARRRVRRSSS